MEQSEQLPVGEIPEEPVKDTGEKREVEKPDFVKKIEGFDTQNLTPENIEFMTGAIWRNTTISRTRLREGASSHHL